MNEREFPFEFRCRRSGNCCARPEGVVRVTTDDVALIAAHLGIGEAAFRSRYMAASGDRLIDAPGGRCAFLVEGREAACSIYDVRPERCRTWPFWPELLEDPKALAAALRSCPGIEPRSTCGRTVTTS